MTPSEYHRANLSRQQGYKPRRIAADLGLTLAAYYSARRRYEAQRLPRAARRMLAEGYSVGVVRACFGRASGETR